ncbi:Adenosine 5'-monophosphoramidase [Actinomortierella ambigua]|uniref:Adenosine 5'-monophosphoramidase n=1 Tax=Actinomortierella ambigua TaxID=1343610 RepID=A0A9P6Q9Y5_9FUNG|nr:Adenosine 5'-monophosphoramidase [Actinomortierella ambigua]
MHELPDDTLADLLPLIKKVVNALDAENYNILQNNGGIAHQHIWHVHFHIIPKPNEKEGLVMQLDNHGRSDAYLDAVFETIKTRAHLP